jgi:hypothetical protein
MSRYDDNLAEELDRRLDQRDYDSSSSSRESFAPGPGDKGFVPHDMRWSREEENARKDDGGLRDNIIRMYKQSADKQAQKDLYNPSSPKVADEALDGETDAAREVEHRRKSISEAYDWQHIPLPDRQLGAYAAKQVEAAKATARAYGIAEPKTAQDVSKALELMQGGSAAKQQPAADPAWALSLIDNVVIPICAHAAELGITPEHLMRQLSAADRIISQDPLAAVDIILAQRGVIKHSMRPLFELAYRSGTTLPEALGRYIQVERALEAQPVQALLWLCDQYGVSPGHLLAAMKQPRAA